VLEVLVQLGTVARFPQDIAMLGIFITFLTFVLILVTLFMCLVVLMQRPNANAGMGAAFGGGVTESTFGAETTNVLTRATKWSGITFFVFALLLYALYLVDSTPDEAEALTLPEFATEESAGIEAPDTAGDPSLIEDAQAAAADISVTVDSKTEEVVGAVEDAAEQVDPVKTPGPPSQQN
jgi:preprotein translocase subunit SecG|tara:strand:+ start:624 stop:1163 length:540 start_codon:yes stop_codon:yes gene_type:complete